ncbi:MAG: S24/S26 family peptidase [Chloroflexi bacterium]|nr:S24/S26 family peptidase [Chloroflexota bacterium]
MASQAETSLFAAGEVMQAGQPLRLRVNGESMSPWLRRGDWIVVHAVQADRLTLGDILLTARQGEMVTHRLVARGAGGWYTKGDHFFHLDPPLEAGAILGVVRAVERGAGRAAMDVGAWSALNRRLARLSRWEAAWFERLAGWKIGCYCPGAYAAPLLAAAYRLPLACLAAWRRSS